MQDSIIDALRRQATDEALNAARDWVFRAPEDAAAHRWLAVAWQQKGDHDAATASIDRAIVLAPQDADLHLIRATLLVQQRQIEQAQGALSEARQLNPNQIGAYLLQAQLAFARGDVAEAEHQARLAARVDARHPQLAGIESLVALSREDHDLALRKVTEGLKRTPDDAQLQYAAGFAYRAKGHLAFAEQAFRRLLEQLPEARHLRILIAELVARQGRLDEAAELLEPVLADSTQATPALLRLAGGLRMDAGQVEQALPLLRQALAGAPGHRPTLQALLDAWRRLGRQDEAPGTLEAALATTPDSADLWEARMVIEADREARLAIVDRWQGAMPSSTLPLEVRMLHQQEAGQVEEADATAWRILELAPEHPDARMQLLDTRMKRDPAEAVAQIEAWLQADASQQSRYFLRGMLGLSHDRSGAFAQAVEAWTALHAELATQRAPLPPHSAPRQDWPAAAARAEGGPKVLFLCGVPGAGVERLATVMQAAGEPFRGDRFGPTPPADGFQSFHLIDGLSDASIDAAAVANRWRALLPARGRQDGYCIDWLMWWDNALLQVLRPHLPEAMLVFAIRDPRDALLEWLAFSSVLPFAYPSTDEAAAWLARALEQVADVHEQNLFPNRIIRTDAIGHDPQLAAAAVSQALGTQMPVPVNIGPPRFPAGHWRQYAQALAGPLERLSAIASRLGYPAA
jgi:tetratricopeptide (TPR) repeat protein